MKNLFLLSLILFYGITTFAQDLKTVKLPSGAMRESKTIVDGITTHIYSSGNKIPVNGDPYFDKNFKPGILELNDNSKSKETPMRYNVANDVFEIIQGTDTLTINQPFKLKQITVDGITFIYDPKLREGSERKYNGYFQQKVNGELSLYVKRRKELVFDSFANNYQGGSGTKEYYYVDEVSYVGKFDNSNGFILNSPRKFLKNIKEHKSEMKSFIKENKIKFKNEDDLVRLVKYYNEL